MRRADHHAAVARTWLEAFNHQDLETLLSLYAEDCVHHSPKLLARDPATRGEVRGKAALRAWWADAFARLPGLRYRALSVTADEARAVLEYARVVPGEPELRVLELFEIQHGAIVTSRVFHG